MFCARAACLHLMRCAAHVGVLKRLLDGGCAESVDYMCSVLYCLSVQRVFTACGLNQENELPY